MSGAQGCIRRPAAIRAIVREISAATGVPAHEIVGPFLNRRAAAARQYGMWRARLELGLSYPELARSFGRKDHTTAMHAVRVVSQRMAAE